MKKIKTETNKKKASTIRRKSLIRDKSLAKRYSLKSNESYEKRLMEELENESFSSDSSEKKKNDKLLPNGVIMEDVNESFTSISLSEISRENEKLVKR